MHGKAVVPRDCPACRRGALCCIAKSNPFPVIPTKTGVCRVVDAGFFASMAEGEARTAWKYAIPARCAVSNGRRRSENDAQAFLFAICFFGENHGISYFRVMAKSISYATITMYIQACNQSPLRFYEWKGCQHYEKTHWSVFIRAPVSAASFRDDPAARLGGA